MLRMLKLMLFPKGFSSDSGKLKFLLFTYFGCSIMVPLLSRTGSVQDCITVPFTSFFSSDSFTSSFQLNMHMELMEIDTRHGVHSVDMKNYIYMDMDKKLVKSVDMDIKMDKGMFMVNIQ